MKVQVLSGAPNSKNPNPIPIGEGFGFLLYLDYPNLNQVEIKSNADMIFQTKQLIF